MAFWSDYHKTLGSFIDILFTLFLQKMHEIASQDLFGFSSRALMMSGRLRMSVSWVPAILDASQWNLGDQRLKASLSPSPD
ncbi:hypothetical protein VULLAG_LOCUS20424 [Vulpes lagopus]